MADQQITDLPVATEAEDADLLLMRQGSTDKQIAKSVLFAESLSTLENLNDVVNKATARSNLDVPQTATVVLKANNLSDLPNAATARDNLGVEIGADVQAYDADLAAIAAFASTGIAVRTGLNTWEQRSVTNGSSKVSVTNGDGASGNISVDVVEANLNMNNSGTVLAVPKGGTGLASLTAYGLVAAGTTTTGNAQVIAPATTGKILRGAGTGALPVFDVGVVPIGGNRGTFGSGINNPGYSISTPPFCSPPSPDTTNFTFPSGTTGALMFFPLFLPVDITIDNNCRYRYAFGSLVALTGEITCALYNDSGIGTGPTGSPISNTTITQISGGSTLHFPSSTLLTAGLYWLAVSTNQPSATMYGFKSGPGLMSFNSFIGGDSRITQALVGWKQNFTYSTTFPAVGTLTEIFSTDNPSSPVAPVVPLIYLSSN